ncbi:alpha/beta hydrolase [Promicromonospora panici]|uniref:alpha/beta hydrolase n=1 Tax=Promicromonospora panici TaxID=2219658 RepID=UPI00101C3D47|nr:alpha/beta hydrolase [Promicromonospora panici]
MPRLTAASLRALARTAPPLAAEVATRFFFRVGPPAAVRPQERVAHEAARRSTIRYRRPATTGREPVDVVVYAWGEPGAPGVLLVHGWQSRASFFAPLVEDLVASGLRVVAYDAPAHGDSGGRRRTIVDDVAIVHRLSDAEPAPWEGIVGHSAGALAAGVALADGVAARRFTSVSGPSAASALADGFFAITGLPRSLRQRFDDVVRRRRFPDVPDIYERYDLTRRPVPGAVPALLLHDTDDRQVPYRHAERMLAAHADSAELVTTTGLGHNRILRDPAVRRSVLDHLAAPVPARSGAGERCRQ